MIFLNPVFLWYTPSTEQECRSAFCDKDSGTSVALSLLFCIQMEEKSPMFASHHLIVTVKISPMERVFIYLGRAI